METPLIRHPVECFGVVDGGDDGAGPIIIQVLQYSLPHLYEYVVSSEAPDPSILVCPKFDLGFKPAKDIRLVNFT